MADTYKILRFYNPGLAQEATAKPTVAWLTPEEHVIQRGLTLEEAEAHCKSPSSRKDGVYFDGYTKEDPNEDQIEDDGTGNWAEHGGRP